MSSRIEKTKDFLINYSDILCKTGGSGTSPRFPEFELYARDYLKFTEEEMEKKTPVSLINCISHLKRAMDCQLDTFLYSFNLLKLFST